MTTDAIFHHSEMAPRPVISLRKATHEDIDFLFGLRQATMRAVVSNHYPWDDKAQLDRIAVNLDDARIILLDGVRAGLLKVVDEARHVHLSQIQLLPEFQGLGIGSHLIGVVVREAHAEHKSVTLHVLKSNPAVALYRRLGFTESSEDQHSFRMVLLPLNQEAAP